MQIYLVGGAVRDQLLGLPVKDHDWVITGADPQQLLQQGYEQVGADFPVFLHPDTHEEYALARTERKNGHGYQGFDCRFSPDVTLEQDLLRRDLTINAMAIDDNGHLYDPYNGQRDLDQRLLRHVSPAFSEDPLRVLRVARFAARFASLGFQVADETMQLMQRMVADGELEHLVAERVWTETARALGEQRPDVYFEVLRESGALKVLFREIDALFGVPQPPRHHPEIDCGIHALMSLQAAVQLSSDIRVRWAALTHDLGKALTPQAEWPRHIAHEARGKQPLKQLSERLKVPREASELALIACEFHTHVHRALELKAETILKLFTQTDAWRRPERFEQLLLAATADSRGRTGFETIDYPQANYLRTALALTQQVSARDFVSQGLAGKAIGEAVNNERQQRLQRWIIEQRPSAPQE